MEGPALSFALQQSRKCRRVAQPIAFLAKAGAFSQSTHPLRIVIPTGASHPERDGKRSGGTCYFFRLRQSRQCARGDTIVSDVGGVRLR